MMTDILPRRFGNLWERQETPTVRRNAAGHKLKGLAPSKLFWVLQDSSELRYQTAGANLPPFPPLGYGKDQQKVGAPP
jgi:hypothetical protein